MTCLHKWITSDRIDTTLDGTERWAWFKCSECGADGFQTNPSKRRTHGIQEWKPHHAKVIK